MRQKKICTYMCILLLIIFKLIPDRMFVIAFPVDYCTEVNLILFC